MRIYTKIVWDCDGTLLESESCEYTGDIALCDRAAQSAANQARKTAEGQAGTYGATAQGIEGDIVPRLENEAQSGGPGYGPIGLGDMETEAIQTGAGASGAATERARLSAIRTGNRAGVGAVTAAGAGESARATGGALQAILAKNAQLKAQQREQANQELVGLVGEDIKGQGMEAGLVPEDINASVNAGKSGWLQNTLATIATLTGSGKDTGAAYKSLTS